MQLFCCVNTSYHDCAIKVRIIINNNAAKWTKLIKRLEDNDTDVSFGGDKTNYTNRQKLSLWSETFDLTLSQII